MMNEFKKMVQEDIESIFLDLDMFGEEHMVAGKKRTIILDDVENLRRSEQVQDPEAVHKKRRMFYVAAKEFKKMPNAGMMIELDGKSYKIVRVEDESGILAITIEIPEQR